MKRTKENITLLYRKTEWKVTGQYNHTFSHRVNRRNNEAQLWKQIAETMKAAHSKHAERCKWKLSDVTKHWYRKKATAKLLFKGALEQAYHHLSQISLVNMSFKGRAKKENQDKVLTRSRKGLWAQGQLVKFWGDQHIHAAFVDMLKECLCRKPASFCLQVSNLQKTWAE